MFFFSIVHVSGDPYFEPFSSVFFVPSSHGLKLNTKNDQDFMFL